ncbi:MAG: alpha/beta hydrolase family protein, partial [Gammaproteobacteria bacterium]
IVWADPREFTSAGAAGQVTGSPNRFTEINFGNMHFLFLAHGYALLVPSMPIVGPGETANDAYVKQLVANAQAAVDTVVSMGVAERERIGIAGHSYGAFMTANLLAHSDIFQAGMAWSGAYNRSLTPFGFQNERRTIWDVADVYTRMSPFFHADKVNEPILLIHGEIDANSGTFPGGVGALLYGAQGQREAGEIRDATTRGASLCGAGDTPSCRSGGLELVRRTREKLDRWDANVDIRRDEGR